MPCSEWLREASVGALRAGVLGAGISLTLGRDEERLQRALKGINGENGGGGAGEASPRIATPLGSFRRPSAALQ